MVRYFRSNVLGFVAIFIALGGLGYAAGLARDSVRSKHIKDGQVKSVDVRDDGLTGEDLANGSVGAADLAATSAARVRLSLPPVLANDTLTVLDFDRETFDTGELHDNATDPSRLTAPVDGYYMVNGQVGFTGATGGSRRVLLQVNRNIGGVAESRTAASSDSTVLQVTTIVELSAGDHVELSAFQDRGLPLPVIASQTYLAMAWIGPSAP